MKYFENYTSFWLLNKIEKSYVLFRNLETNLIYLS